MASEMERLFTQTANLRKDIKRRSGELPTSSILGLDDRLKPIEYPF